MRPASESSHHRNDRRDGPRGPPRGGRPTWVPKGSEISSNLNVNGGESQANVNPIRPRPSWESPNNTNPCRSQPDCESHTNANPNRLRSNCELHNNVNSNRLRPNCESLNNVNRPRSNVNRRSYVVQHVNKEVAENSDAGGGSSVPQLVQEIQDKLTKGTVECMICYDMVRRSAAIWSCSSCFSIFHLMCIKKWARAPTSIDVSAEKDQGLNWRCPGCQSVQLVASKEIKYTCFCGKLPDPPSDLYLTPHSCGESCGKALEREVVVTEGPDEYRCSHLCVLQCHPGPCPPCKAFAPSRQCPCGKKTINRRCSDRKTTPSCGLPCNKVLECGRHRCERTCHVGPCDSCKVLVNASCFCKKKTEVVFCGEMSLTGEVDEINGLFSCKSVCGKILSCENHSCTSRCHPGMCGDCDFLPGKIKTCYCGKTPLETERKSCLDSILMCSEVCGRALRCGVHPCKSKCHEGECPPCMVLVEQRCRCGSASRTVECYKTMEESYKFVCERPCGRKKNCGRHRCNERCCPLSSSNSRVSEDWDPHLCSVVCGKKLRCGQHVCESLCHSGHCPPCLETIFADLSCACGKTVIPPPLPCGTQPPACPHSCSFPQACGHSSTHSCHFGDCPPCAVPIAKECIGGHVVLRNIPCGSRDIRCNQLCGKTRQCGMHACARTCHPPPCDTSSGSTSALGSKVSCGQVCGAPRRDCRHTCTASCHPSSPCPDQRCNFPVTITCSCGRISASVPCDAGGSNPSGFHGDTVFEASVIQKLPVPLQPTEANGKKIPLGQRKLVCNEECAKLERKRLLADAFDITPPNLDSLHFGENNAVSEMLTDLFRREPKWVVAIEERLKFLVFGKNKGSSSGSLRVHVFSAAVKEKRDAIRQLAERWKLSIQAAGWEPRRFLVVHVTPKSKAPARILGARPGTSLTGTQPPVFDPSIDMDPRLVVALLDLPRDADISTLVLRFGGECELVWLNDKNALAIFSDPARATTALRRLDHGSVYQGAVVVLSGSSPTNTAWGPKDGVGNDPAGATRVNNPWKKAVVQELGWNEDSSWGHNWPNNGSGADSQLSAWRGKEASALVTSSRNRWDVLNTDLASNSTSATNLDSGQDLLGLQQKEGSSLSVEARAFGGDGESGQIEEIDDWEKAFE